jgi:hypothetical protein
MFIISVSQDFALAVVYSTRELAEAAAVRMGLRDYEVVRAFATGERVIFRESETGSEEIGTIREVLADKFYIVGLDDGTEVEAFHVELSPISE